MEKTYKRRKFIVCGFQYKLLGGNFLYMLPLFLVFVMLVFIPSVHDLDDQALASEQRDQAAATLLTLQSTVWVTLPLILALCAVHSIVVSHRIAGPLFRFKQVFCDLGQGDLSARASIRRKDYLHGEARAMNKMIASLEERISLVQRSYRDVRTTLPDLLEIVESERGEDAALIVGKLGTQMDELGEHLRAFRTSGSLGEPPGTAVDRTRRRTAPVA